MSDLQSALREALVGALNPVKLVIRDDSAAHAGHAGARSGAHLFAHIVAARFQGLGMLARHRLVYAAAAPLLATRIHALQLLTQTPDEAQSRAQLSD